MGISWAAVRGDYGDSGDGRAPSDRGRSVFQLCRLASGGRGGSEWVGSRG